MQSQEYQVAARAQPPRLLSRCRGSNQTSRAVLDKDSGVGEHISPVVQATEPHATDDSDWDKPPKEIQLAVPSLTCLREQWFIQSGKSITAPTLDPMDTTWHSEGELDLLHYFNNQLDASKHLPDLELSEIRSYIEKVVSAQTGNWCQCIYKKSLTTCDVGSAEFDISASFEKSFSHHLEAYELHRSQWNSHGASRGHRSDHLVHRQKPNARTGAIVQSIRVTFPEIVIALRRHPILIDIY
jgi:hypothetical protein